MNTLVGRVVRLEPLATHHTPDLFAALGNDEEAWRWMLSKAPTSVTEMGSFVENLLTNYANGSREPYAVINLQSEKAIGTTSYMDIARAHKIRTDGTSRDTVYFSIVKNEWPEVKARLLKALQ